MKCLSICRSIHARSTTEKYGDLFSCRFSIRTRKWETTPGFVEHSSLGYFFPFFLFLILYFQCFGSIGSFTRSRLFETHLRKDRSSVDIISFPFFFFFLFPFPSIRYPATNARVHGFVRKYIWFSLLKTLC